MLEETKSNWSCVADGLMQETPEINLGPTNSQRFYHHPVDFLHYMTLYKFACKMIGKEKRVLDLGCQEGFGTFLLGKECGFSLGVDPNKNSIANAMENFTEPFVGFQVSGNNLPKGSWDTILSLHHTTEDIHSLLDKIPQHLSHTGQCIIGIKDSSSPLETILSHYFEFVFTFSAIGEMIHIGTVPESTHILALGCKKKI